MQKRTLALIFLFSLHAAPIFGAEANVGGAGSAILRFLTKAKDFITNANVETKEATFSQAGLSMSINEAQIDSLSDLQEVLKQTDFTAEVHISIDIKDEGLRKCSSTKQATIEEVLKNDARSLKELDAWVNELVARTKFFADEAHREKVVLKASGRGRYIGQKLAAVENIRPFQLAPDSEKLLAAIMSHLEKKTATLPSVGSLSKLTFKRQIFGQRKSGICFVEILRQENTTTLVARAVYLTSLEQI